MTKLSENAYEATKEWRGDSQRLNICYVKQKTIELSDGYKCLSNIYKNNNTKLEFECKSGHIYKATWGKFQSGRRCPYCNGGKKYTINYIKNEVRRLSDNKFVCLSNKYISSMEKLKMECDKGHVFYISWDNYKQGHRCRVCTYETHPTTFKHGEQHPNWMGGVSWEPYCEAWVDIEFKKSIKERDKYKCQNESCWGTAKRLAIHHINYNKKDCRPINLITLCTSCNTRANVDRKMWKGHYKGVLQNNERIIPTINI